ncbi:MAG: hypothetical protein O3C28_12400, partial [Proteobacteria bacterium]|nr:hypothetical protein [Pseudomonadota bacterium]
DSYPIGNTAPPPDSYHVGIDYGFIIDSRYAIIPPVTQKIQTPHHCRLRRKAIQQVERSAHAPAKGAARRMHSTAQLNRIVGRP